MASSSVTPDYSKPGKGGFTEPLPEADRWKENREAHFVPEWEQSGGLPAAPGSPDAAPGNANPTKPL